MVTPLVEAFAKPPTAAERWGRGIAGALIGTRAGAEQVMREIAADDWAISPYRRWLTGLVGGDIGEYESNLRKAETEMNSQKSRVEEYKELLKRGETVLPTINAGKYLKRVIRSGETASQIALDISKRLNVPLSDEQKEKLPSEISAGNTISANKNFAGVVMELVNTANKRAGKSIKEELEDAENLFTSSRSKYNKSIRKFNEKIPKKTDLEKMTGLSLSRTRAMYRGVGRESPEERMAKQTLLKRIFSNIDGLKKQRSVVPVVEIEGEKINLDTNLAQILEHLDAQVMNLISPQMSYSQALTYSRPIFSALSDMWNVKKIKTEEAVIPILTGLRKKRAFVIPKTPAIKRVIGEPVIKFD